MCRFQLVANSRQSNRGNMITKLAEAFLGDFNRNVAQSKVQHPCKFGEWVCKVGSPGASTFCHDHYTTAQEISSSLTGPATSYYFHIFAYTVTFDYNFSSFSPVKIPYVFICHPFFQKSNLEIFKSSTLLPKDAYTLLSRKYLLNVYFIPATMLHLVTY